MLKVCRPLAPEDPKALAQRCFGENHAASVIAKDNNGWRPTPGHLLKEVRAACVEHAHGGLWNALNYDTRDVVSIDMRSCYPASFRGHGEASPWFKRFGHPGHRMTRVSINGPPPGHRHRLCPCTNMGICSRLPSHHSCLVWTPYIGEGMGTNAIIVLSNRE